MAIRRKVAGYIYIDAGLCIVGDPCYLRTSDGDTARETLPLDGTWEDFVGRLPDPPHNRIQRPSASLTHANCARGPA